MIILVIYYEVIEVYVVFEYIGEVMLVFMYFFVVDVVE